MRNEEIEQIAKACGITKGLRLTRENLAERIEQAVHDGQLDPQILGHFNTSPLQALRMIPEKVAKSYGLPCASTDSASSREETELVLEKAVQDGKLDPRVLGAFRTQPMNVLENIPEAVAKSYGLPRPAKREIPKMPAYYAPWWEWAEYNRAMNR